MSDVKLVIESIPIPAEGFSEEIRGCSLTDEAGHPEKTCDERFKALEKLSFFIFIFIFVFVAVSIRCRSYLLFALSGDDL